jgi:uncharacterized protein
MAFSTALLDAALKRRRALNEQQRLAALARVTAWLETQGDRYDIQEAYLFGSIARPYQFSDRSDVDVAAENIRPDLFFDAMASLSEAVERDVDLVELLKCPFAAKIRQQGIRWNRNAGHS